MTVWVDAQQSPRLARWLTARLGVSARHVRDLDLLHATDRAIFARARDAKSVVLTKDADFVALVEQHGPPPQILWITAGNATEARLEELLSSIWPQIQARGRRAADRNHGSALALPPNRRLELPPRGPSGTLGPASRAAHCSSCGGR
jgi:predicted nuclease of predicted toxin-antitoxin system